MRRTVVRLIASIALLVGSACLPLAFAAPASAYTFTGCSWDNPDHIYYTNFATGDYNTIGENAVNDWYGTATPLYFYPSSTLINIEIANANYGNNNYDGITYWGCSGTSLVYADSWWNTYYTDNYGSNAKLQVMVHELGHALGLGHDGTASCSGQPIMYYSSNRFFVCGHIDPQTDDINGINVLY